MKDIYCWNLKDIYGSSIAFENDYEKVIEFLTRIEELKGRLGSSSNYLFACYNLLEEITKIIEKIDAYATLQFHQNMAKNASIKLYKRVENLIDQYNVKTSYIEPEINEIEDKILYQFLDENDKLKKYQRLIEKMIKNKSHILSKDAEYIVSNYSSVLNSFHDIYTLLCDVDFKFGTITLPDGSKKEITQGNYISFVTNKNRDIRKEAFDIVHIKYKECINAMTQNYIASVKEDTITARLRKYASSLEKAVIKDESSVVVYHNLVKTVNENLWMNHQFMELKTKLLGIDKLHIYDTLVNPLTIGSGKITIEEARKIIKNAIMPLGQEYVAMFNKAFEAHWFDIFERENKYSGGYNTGVYGVHPYILLNYTNDIESVSTVAHEFGHAMHSYYSNNKQDILSSNYTIMIAEIASTVNEILLAEYQISQEENVEKKKSLLYSLIDRIRATLISQTMFAEFEKSVHEKVENNETLSPNEICDIYSSLQKKYLGKSVEIDEGAKYDWARIPHFYRPFYVYKYATGISCAITIATKILKREEGFLEKYINMLSLGNSKDSLVLLKEIGIDLESKAFMEEAFGYYHSKIQQLENLI
ncbi:MAG: oligoendopeptidase F [Clostridia bacterium]|nr:oligoendopeptidase F [Clostridia bacterium]